MTYDLLIWSIPAIKRFPRDQRYLLGDRIENGLLDTLELLIEARYTRAKLGLLRKANVTLEKQRFLFRAAKDLRYLDLRRYMVVQIYPTNQPPGSGSPS